jgi:hypothetical protein
MHTSCHGVAGVDAGRTALPCAGGGSTGMATSFAWLLFAAAARDGAAVASRGSLRRDVNVREYPSVIETGHRPSLDDRCDYNRIVPHAVIE